MIERISVIIPTYNGDRQLPQLLSAIKKQTLKIDEILVVDSSSKDDTVSVAKSFGARVEVVPTEEFDHGGTRTLAAKMAIGDILIYFTQDAFPVNDYAIEGLIKPFSDDEAIGATFGQQIAYPDADIFFTHLREFNYPAESYLMSLKDKERRGIKAAFLSNAFSAYKKDALAAVGWFKTSLIISEDMYIGAKLLLAGYKISYIATSAVYHSHNYGMFQEFQRYFDIGVLHTKENWILKEFGKAEDEGKKYLISQLEFLSRIKKRYLLPKFLFRDIIKYMGYVLGRSFEKLPRWLNKKLSMNKNWWNKNAAL
jgi:rhamnosyltransferase